MEYSSEELVSRFRAGDEDAATELHHRFVERLIALAQRLLAPQLVARIDAEDVVQSAYRSFFVGVREGRLTIQRSGQLWRLLAQITRHKLLDQVNHHRAACRTPAEETHGAEHFLAAREPTPADVLEVAEQIQRLLLPLDPVRRQMLQLRLQDYSIEEISAKTARCERTVRRFLIDLQKTIAAQNDSLAHSRDVARESS